MELHIYRHTFTQSQSESLNTYEKLNIYSVYEEIVARLNCNARPANTDSFNSTIVAICRCLWVAIATTTSITMWRPWPYSSSYFIAKFSIYILNAYMISYIWDARVYFENTRYFRLLDVNIWYGIWSLRLNVMLCMLSLILSHPLPHYTIETFTSWTILSRKYRPIHICWG